MLAKQLQGAAKGLTVDSDFEYTTLLLHGNGTNGAQNNTFIDGSTNNFTITRNGNTTQGTFSPYGNNWSNYFDGTGDGLNAGSQSAYAFGTGPFCIEFWVYNTALKNYSCGVTTRPDNGSYSDAYHIGWDSVGGVSLYVGTTSSPTGPSGTMKVGQWQHFVCCRDSSNNTSIFVNGSRTGTAVITANFTRQLLGVGDFPTTPAEGVQGYLSNVRLVKGSSVYDPTLTTLTVPAAPLTAITNTSILTCQSNRFIDNSANAFAITLNGTPSVQRFSPFSPSAAYSTSVVGGSGYFDGTGDYLTAASNAAFRFGTGNFTIEFWYYPTVFGTNTPIDMGYINSGSYVVQSASDGKPFFYIGGPGTIFTSATAYFLNAWNHLAVVRSGSTLSMFLNGSRVGTATNSTDINANFSLGIGGSPTHSSPFVIQGFLSNVRLVKGTAVYDPSLTTLTVPTAPLTNITNTSLLLDMTNAGIIDNAMMNDLETVGNAQISTTQSKFGGSSMYFDGTGDYLVTPSSPSNILGSGDFTVEFWMYASNTSAAYRALVASENYAATTGGWSIYQNGTSIEVWLSTSTQLINATSVLTATTWQHVALSRASGTVRLFVNGTSVASASNTAEWTGQRIFIGDNNYAGTDYFYNGYIDDLRITKGVARYTANFTAPTAPFADQ